MNTDNNFDFAPTNEQMTEAVERVSKILSERKKSHESLVTDEEYAKLKERLQKLLNKS